VSVRLSLLGPGAQVRAELELPRPGRPARATDADARIAERLAAYLTRPRRARTRVGCVAQRPVPRTGIII